MEAKRTAHQPTKQEQEETYATARCEPLTSSLISTANAPSKQSTVQNIKRSRMPMRWKMHEGKRWGCRLCSGTDANGSRMRRMIRYMNGSRRGESQEVVVGLGCVADCLIDLAGLGRTSVGLYRYSGIRYHHVYATWLFSCPSATTATFALVNAPGVSRQRHSGFRKNPTPFNACSHYFSKLSGRYEIGTSVIHVEHFITAILGIPMECDELPDPRASADIPGYPASSPIQNDIRRSKFRCIRNQELCAQATNQQGSPARLPACIRMLTGYQNSIRE